MLILHVTAQARPEEAPEEPRDGAHQPLCRRVERFLFIVSFLVLVLVLSLVLLFLVTFLLLGCLRLRLFLFVVVERSTNTSITFTLLLSILVISIASVPSSSSRRLSGAGGGERDEVREGGLEAGIRDAVKRLEAEHQPRARHHRVAHHARRVGEAGDGEEAACAAPLEERPGPSEDGHLEDDGDHHGEPADLEYQ